MFCSVRAWPKNPAVSAGCFSRRVGAFPRYCLDLEIRKDWGGVECQALLFLFSSLVIFLNWISPHPTKPQPSQSICGRPLNRQLLHTCRSCFEVMSRLHAQKLHRECCWRIFFVCVMFVELLGCLGFCTNCAQILDGRTDITQKLSLVGI